MYFLFIELHRYLTDYYQNIVSFVFILFFTDDEYSSSETEAKDWQ
jgi:hypothetical protein